MSVLVPMCWMLKLPGSLSNQRICVSSAQDWLPQGRVPRPARAASHAVVRGSQAPRLACWSSATGAGLSWSSSLEEAGTGAEGNGEKGGAHGKRWGDGEAGAGAANTAATCDTEMFAWQGRRVDLPRRKNATCCAQDTRAPMNERRTANAHLHASLPRRLNGAEALVGLSLVQRYAFTYEFLLFRFFESRVIVLLFTWPTLKICTSQPLKKNDP